MTQFLCRLGTPSGDVKVSVYEAENQTSLEKELSDQGYYVFSIAKKGFSLSLPRFRRRQRVKIQTFVLFNQELTALVRAGLPLIQSLEILFERQQDPFFRAVLAEILDKVKSGESLSDAFASYGDSFPKMYSTILRSGERSGELESVLKRFIAYQKIILGVKKKVKGALVYPAILSVLSLGLIVIMMTYVIPRFTFFYQDFNAKLPLITKIVINLSHITVNNGIYILAGLIVGFFFLMSWIRTPIGRRVIDSMILKLPVLGTIFHRFALSQFTRSLATLVEGGTPVVVSLQIAANTVNNSEISTSIQGVVSRVQEGESLWNSLESTGKFTHIAIEMIKVGESTGSLEVMLHNTADFYDEEIDTKLQRVVTLIEPLMLVFMGIIIAVLLASVYMPLLSLIGQLG